MAARKLIVIGGGLAGSEAAWQAAERNMDVHLYEGRPSCPTGAHTTSDLAEVVCSNSLGSNDPHSAPGLLKSELRGVRSLILSVADASSVPAGSALAIDRDVFSREVTRRIEAHPGITLIREEMKEVPDDRPVILATGPLTSPSLSESLSRLTLRDKLYFYDAISPIVDAETIDRSIAFRASRYGNGEGGDYLNCPMNEAEYRKFYQALMSAETVAGKSFEKIPYFEGCMPIEALAERGYQTPLFGPMKPVGLVDPRDGRRPFAAVQLRQEDRFASCYNLVGFQTKLKYPDQKRIFRMIPGLENAEFLRLGSLHRNTFVNSPALLTGALQLKDHPGIFLAGQITGVEGYIESVAMGWLAGINAARLLSGEETVIPPAESAHGALVRYLTESAPDHFQPMNINFGLFPPLAGPPVRGKDQKRDRIARRAREVWEKWIASLSLF